MRPPRVLVLDDEEPVRDLWVDALREAGYDVVGFVRGDEALARLPDIDPAVIVLDMLMPHMDGFEFLARLRAASADRTPLLIISALGESLVHSIDAHGSTILGIAGILMKPVDMSRLVAEIQRIIGDGASDDEGAYRGSSTVA